MTIFYLETSALVKRYKTEKGSEVMDELFDRKRIDEAFATSLFTVLEVVAAATRLFRGRVLDRTEYRTIIRHFLSDANDLVILPVENPLILDAIRTASETSLKAGDALQIASALQVRSSVQGSDEIIMVASDHEVCSASRLLKLSLLDPEEDGAIQRLSEIRR